MLRHIHKKGLGGNFAKLKFFSISLLFFVAKPLMRPARVLNLFISNILPRHESLLLRLQRRNPSTCLGCGRFQSRWKFLRSYSTQPNTIDTSKIRTTETCISIVKLAKQRRPSEALSTYLKLVEQGGFPNQEALYSLARSLYVNNHLVGMQALYDTLDQLYNTCPFSNRTQRSLTYIYTMFINLIARTTGDMQAIQKVCQNMSQPIMRGNVVIYNTLIKTFLENGDIENAKKAYEELKRHSAPTVATFGIWMKDAVERRDMKAMMRYLDEMEAYSIPPDYAMVDMVVSVLCHVNKHRIAKKFIEELHAEAEGLVPKKFKKQLLLKIIKHRKNNNYRKKLYYVNKRNKAPFSS